MFKEKSIRTQVKEALINKFGYWNVSWDTLKISYKNYQVDVMISGKELSLHFDGLIYEA